MSLSIPRSVGCLFEGGSQPVSQRIPLGAISDLSPPGLVTEQLLDQVWELDFVGDSKTVDVHIRWLRKKLEQDPSHPEYIVTVRGFGYRFG